jgi:hypothetical protein
MRLKPCLAIFDSFKGCGLNPGWGRFPLISGDIELKMTNYVGLAIYSVVFNAIWLFMEDDQRHDHRGQDDDDAAGRSPASRAFRFMG